MPIQKLWLAVLLCVGMTFSCGGMAGEIDAGSQGGGSGGSSGSVGGGTAQTGGGTSETGGGSASAGGGTSQTGGGNASTGGGTSETGGGSASTGGGTAETGGGTASTGGGTTSTGGGTSSTTGGGTASTGGGTASTGGGTSSTTGGGTASTGGGTASTGGGTSSTTGGGTASTGGGTSSVTGGGTASTGGGRTGGGTAATGGGTASTGGGRTGGGTAATGGGTSSTTGGGTAATGGGTSSTTGGGTASTGGGAASTGGGTASTGGGTASTGGGSGWSNACGDGVCSSSESCSTCIGDCGLCASAGTVYYVSSVSGLDTNTGLDAQHPWRTLSKVQSAKNIVQAGDSILFKRGETFVGTLRWDRWYGGGAPTGTASAPITFASYGTSTAKPIFQYPALTASSPAPANRVLLSFFGVDYLVIDGLNFTDTAFPRNDKLTPANMGIAIQLGVGGEALNMHNIVRNVDMSNIGMGVTISGDFNVVDHCTMTDLKNLVDTACANPNDTGFCSYDDYGANGVTVTGNDNVISNNLFTGNWAHSTDFVFNGGAVEAYGAMHGLNRNKILYNTIFDCGGVMEIGSSGVASSADNVIAYNLLVNDGMLTWINLAGPFATTTSNVQYYNNTIVQTPTTRFSEGAMFGSGGTITATTLFRIKNNIFYLSNGDDVLRSNVNIAKYDMGNNVYQLGAGSVLNYTAATGDVTVPIATAVFTNTTSSDPTAWDYRLLPNTAARRNGANLNQGFTRDLPGAPITTPPDCGAYQGP